MRTLKEVHARLQSQFLPGHKFSATDGFNLKEAIVSCNMVISLNRESYKHSEGSWPEYTKRVKTTFLGTQESYKKK